MSLESESGPERDQPRSNRIAPQLALALTDPAQPVLLLVAPDDDDDAARVAIEMAATRADQDLPTVLADGGVAAPSLHRLLGVDNLEGLADLFLFGASLQRVATRPAGRPFDFISAGAYVPDPMGVLDNPRWDRIAAELDASGSLMLLFVPAGTPGVGALSRRIGKAILIGDDRQTVRMASRLDQSCRVVGSIEPGGQGDAAAEPVPAAAAGAAGAGEDAALDEPVVIRAERRSRRAPIIMVVILLLAVLAAGGGWWVYQQYFAQPAVPTAADVEAPPAAATPADRGQPLDTPIPISVAVEVHGDLLSARERVTTLQDAEPGITFFLSPMARRGALLYSLYAGLAADAETGTALLQRLVDRGHKTAFDSWAVRPTELSFLLGHYATREAAEARVQSLAEMDIPSYTVPYPYESGETDYRVYGGAYETTAEAEVMREMLENAGEEAELVRRTGEPIR